MPHTFAHFLTELHAALKHPIGGGAVLLAALACSPAIGKEPKSIHTAFQNVVDEEPAPPSHPGPAAKSSNGHAQQSAESLPTPQNGSTASYESQHIEYCPPPAYTRWPIIGPLHRRWVTRTKPHLQATHWGYPEYFEERPFGTYVLQAEQMQIVNGLRDQQVLYDYDFLTGENAAQLTPRGQYQLRKMIRRMECAPGPIIVQTNTNFPNPELDEARRQSVLEELRKLGVPATDDLVVADRPPVPGLQGVEGVMVYGNMLLQTQARGGGFFFDPAGEEGVGGGDTVNVFNGGSNNFNQGAP